MPGQGAEAADIDVAGIMPRHDLRDDAPARDERSELGRHQNDGYLPFRGLLPPEAIAPLVAPGLLTSDGEEAPAPAAGPRAWRTTVANISGSVISCFRSQAMMLRRAAA